MLDFSFNNSFYTSSGGVTYTTASATRTIHYYTDSGYGDPLTWTGTTNPSPITSTILPNETVVLAEVEASESSRALAILRGVEAEAPVTFG